MTTAAADSMREMWRYRELFYFMVWRDIKIRYKQSVLGAAWAVIQPVVTMILFTLVFNKAVGIESDDGTPYAIFSYAALLPWTYFSGAINQAGLSLVNNRQLLTKVYFPRAAIPAAGIIRGLVDFAIASVFLAGLIAYYQWTNAYPNYEFVWSARLLLWPVLVIPLVLLALGVGMLFAALNVKYRDVQYVLPFMLQLWMFLTPIIYPASKLPASIRPYIALNPLTGLIEAFRASLVATRPLDLGQLGVSCVVTTVLLVVGSVYFHRTARGFADVI
jgi:lipopolysaccharide transport system permease protein